MSLLALAHPMRTPPSRLALVVIDDDEHVRRAVGRLLGSHGHLVNTFESAEAYLEDQHDADCLIVDIGLPGISGLELEQRIRRRGLHTSVVFVTAQDEASLAAAIEQTERRCLRKPFEDTCLLDAIARSIDEHS
jgi:FixJ family two-component response regulator